VLIRTVQRDRHVPHRRPVLFCRDDVRMYTPHTWPPILREGKPQRSHVCLHIAALATAKAARPATSRDLPASCAHQLRNSGEAPAAFSPVASPNRNCTSWPKGPPYRSVGRQCKTTRAVEEDQSTTSRLGHLCSLQQLINGVACSQESLPFRGHPHRGRPGCPAFAMTRRATASRRGEIMALSVPPAPQRRARAARSYVLRPADRQENCSPPSSSPARRSWCSRGGPR
jgi:hypothetical protein